MADRSQPALPLSDGQEATGPTVPSPPQTGRWWLSPSKSAASPDRGRTDTKKARLLREITAILSLRGTVHRKQILDHLIDKKIMGQETKPLDSLGIFLSTHKDRFMSVGGGNFRLRSPTENDPSVKVSSDDSPVQ